MSCSSLILFFFFSLSFYTKTRFDFILTWSLNFCTSFYFLFAFSLSYFHVSFFLALCKIFWISGPNSQLILNISSHLVLFFRFYLLFSNINRFFLWKYLQKGINNPQFFTHNSWVKWRPQFFSPINRFLLETIFSMQIFVAI